MKVVIVDPPILGHRIRGTGVYAKYYAQVLEKYGGVEVMTVEISDLPKDADIYHFPYFDPFFLTLPFFKNKKIVVTIHDLIPLLFPGHFPRGIKGEIKWQIQKWLIHNVDAIITDSYASKKDIIDILHIDPQKIHPIYLAPLENFFEKKTSSEKEHVRKKYQLPANFALYVGETNWNKNLPNMIRAVKKAKTHLVIVSKSFVEKHDMSYNPWKESLLEAQHEAAGSHLIHGIGHIDLDDLISLYQLAEVLLLPSYYEGFGLPVVEAFASECPVIASHRGSLAEIVGKAGIIVNPDSVEDLVSALVKIHADKALRKMLVHEGKLQLGKFSWKKTVQETVKVYNSILNI